MTNSVLVYVGIDAVGDGLIKLPFVRALRAAFPSARLTWLAGKGESVYGRSLRPLVEGLLDEVVDQAGIGSRPGELLRRPLAGRRFDLIIDTQRRVLTSLILRRIRHHRFISAAAGFLLSDARPRERGKPESMAGQLAQLVELATGRPPGTPAPLPRVAAIEAEAEALLPAGPRYVGFAPGAGGRHKCWPLERFLTLAATLAAEDYRPVFLLGPAEAADWAGLIRETLPEALLPLQAADDPTPLLTIALGRRLIAAVANDSGTGHMLAAADIALVSLFGPTPAAKFAPVTARPTVLRAQDFGGETMAAIPPGAVEHALRRALIPEPLCF